MKNDSVGSGRCIAEHINTSLFLVWKAAFAPSGFIQSYCIFNQSGWCDTYPASVRTLLRFKNNNTIFIFYFIIYYCIKIFASADGQCQQNICAISLKTPVTICPFQFWLNRRFKINVQQILKVISPLTSISAAVFHIYCLLCCVKPTLNETCCNRPDGVHRAFMLECKWMFVQVLKKFSQEIPEGSCSVEWDKQVAGHLNVWNQLCKQGHCREQAQTEDSMSNLKHIFVDFSKNVFNIFNLFFLF